MSLRLSISDTFMYVMVLLSFCSSIQAGQLGQEIKFATVSQGAVTNCDFDGSTDPQNTSIGIIQKAINSPENYDEIRVKAGFYHENITLNGRSITIKGNYLTCEDAVNDIQVDLETEIAGDLIDERATVHLTGVFDGPVVFDGLFFERSGFNADHNGGGLFIDNATVDVELTNMRIFANEAKYGGGIAVIGGAVNLVVYNTINDLNKAEKGGGIYCSGENSTVKFLIDDTGASASITNNVAIEGDGGGILLENGCQFVTNLGSIFQGGLRAISRNQAAGNGGGIAVKSGANATLIGLMDESNGVPGTGFPVSIKFNRADSDGDGLGDGGAIYVSGAGSRTDVTHAIIRQNKAVNGAAVAVTDGGEFSISRDVNKPCWDDTNCNLILDNEATEKAGAIFVSQAATAKIHMTRMTENRSNLAASVFVQGNESFAEMQTVLVDANGDNGEGNFIDQFLFSVQSGASMSLQFSTIANNLTTSSTFQNTDAELIIQHTIVSENMAPINLYEADANAHLNLNCSLVENVNGIPQGQLGSNMLIGIDPLFVDPDSSDYHLSELSPAIDYCDSDLKFLHDIDKQSRPFDVFDVNDDTGIFDIGFDEFYLIADDLIFADGF